MEKYGRPARDLIVSDARACLLTRCSTLYTLYTAPAVFTKPPGHCGLILKGQGFAPVFQDNNLNHSPVVVLCSFGEGLCSYFLILYFCSSYTAGYRLTTRFYFIHVYK